MVGQPGVCVAAGVSSWRDPAPGCRWSLSGAFCLTPSPFSPFSPSPAADEAFSFKYSPGKLRGNQYKSMMTKEELEEEQRYVELPCSPRPAWSAPS